MTTDKAFQYPALYATAGQMSADGQRLYFRLIRAEYAALFVVSVLSMNFLVHSGYYAASAMVIIVAVSLLISRFWLKPEQDWYRGRALAESIKTSCWKYCMRAEPFGDADQVAVRRSEFRNYLLEILEANRHIGDRLPPDHAATDQVTQTMESVRALNLEDRKIYYDTHRIREQRSWYARKASENKKASKRWVGVGVVAYALALTAVLARIVLPDWTFWPIEPLLVVAASVIGWMQSKKFNELASSYTLTAHEIGIIHGRVADAKDEKDFSTFVNDAEQAFSREHTQWVARQRT